MEGPFGSRSWATLASSRLPAFPLSSVQKASLVAGPWDLGRGKGGIEKLISEATMEKMISEARTRKSVYIGEREEKKDEMRSQQVGRGRGLA